ncbi:Citrate Succinate antiporter (TC 2.A.47.3.2) [Halomonas citrativorans]|uniref:Citrate Succinate antiporter (TC 2.A.47.3.2) n=1 Tax=Halomonas citrativorans TaxID=2742612 RepID=A0A1R4I4Z4_9GAMM|nr:anion permease [Halomonas citrativorans]SJN14674.1 Citrate Succinate antiporter (TC 2.A.47.3.2) [Halomonas citrativorans]
MKINSVSSEEIRLLSQPIRGGQLDMNSSVQSAFDWKLLAPLVVAIIVALIPTPEGVAPHAWYFFAIFLGCVVGLIFEPLPGAVIGLIGVTLVALLSRWVLFSPEQLATEGFNAANQAFSWAVSGFTNSTVWLIFGAFMFALGYEKTGLGRRISLWLVKAMGKRTLTLGYAVMIADAVLAPFTPSNTARSGGTIYPVIRNLPPLYDSQPNDPSMKRMGSFLMWTAITSTCVTSSLFLTALAPNLLAIALTESATGIHINWGQWFIAVAPAGILLLLLVPLLCYWLCAPEVKAGEEVSNWARDELNKLGALTRNEILLVIMVVTALLLWIFAGDVVSASLVGLVVICCMLLTGIVSWNDILDNRAAWNTFVWFATLVALAGGLSQVGFVNWFGGMVGEQISHFNPVMAMVALTVIFYLLHYLFASVTAHVTALLPVMLAAASGIAGLDMQMFILLLLPTLGFMGIITPYGTGPSPVYYGSGYLPSALYWRLGAIFGLLFLVAWLAIGLPWLLLIN